MQGGGRGELKLRVTFWPLDKMGGHADARFGALVVTVIRCDNLPAADVAMGTSDPFVRLHCNGETQTTPVIGSTCNPKWVGCIIDFFKVPAREQLKLEIIDKNVLLTNTRLGTVMVDLHKEVALAPGGDVTKTFELKDVLKRDAIREFIGSAVRLAVPDGPPTITMRLQWIPFSGI